MTPATLGRICMKAAEECLRDQSSQYKNSSRIRLSQEVVDVYQDLWNEMTMQDEKELTDKLTTEQIKSYLLLSNYILNQMTTFSMGLDGVATPRK